MREPCTNYILCNSLMSLPIKSSVFVCKHKQILKDEEFIENNKIVKCFCCESTNIKSFYTRTIDEAKVEMKKMGLFTIPLKMFDINFNASQFDLEYCDDCKKALSCNGELLLFDMNFSEGTLFDIMVDEGTIDEDGTPLVCPYCNHDVFIKKNIYRDEMGEVEYDDVCKNCGHPLIHFAYGQREILPF